MQSIQKKIVEKMQLLPEDALNQVLDFVESLSQQSVKKPVGVPGKELLQFAGLIPADDLEMMAKTIEADCRKVDLDEW